MAFNQGELRRQDGKFNIEKLSQLLLKKQQPAKE